MAPLTRINIPQALPKCQNLCRKTIARFSQGMRTMERERTI